MALRDVIAVLSGVLCAGAWWVWIDAHIYSVKFVPSDPILFYYYLPGIFGTLALILTNIVDVESINPYSWVFDDSVGKKVKLWLFGCFILSFCSLGAAIWIMADPFKGTEYPGIALVIQAAVLMLSSMLLLWCRAAKKEEDYEQF